jgi:hypothetical protein
MKTMDEMADDEASWPLLRDLIRSDHVAIVRVIALLADHPAFAAYYRETSPT